MVPVYPVNDKCLQPLNILRLQPLLELPLMKAMITLLTTLNLRCLEK